MYLGYFFAYLQHIHDEAPKSSSKLDELLFTWLRSLTADQLRISRALCKFNVCRCSRNYTMQLKGKDYLI